MDHLLIGTGHEFDVGLLPRPGRAAEVGDGNAWVTALGHVCSLSGPGYWALAALHENITGAGSSGDELRGREEREGKGCDNDEVDHFALHRRAVVSQACELKCAANAFVSGEVLG